MTIDVDALKARNPLEIIAGSYTKLTREGRLWRGACPIHGGDGQNFVVYPPGNGHVGGTFHCFSRNCHDDGKYVPDVIQFIKLMEGLDYKRTLEFLGGEHEWKPEIVKPPRPPLADRQTAKPPEGNEPASFRHGKLGEPDAVRRLCDLDGSLLGFEVRYPRGSDPDEPDKSPSRMWTWGSRDGTEWGWAMGAFSRPRPLYGLDRINGKPQILIHEGPKKADAGQQLLPGAASVSWTGGADAWKYHDLQPIAGRNCIIWPDNDEKGLKCARALAEVLADPNGLSCTVALLIDESKPATWDAADAVAEGWTTEQAYEWAKAHKLPVIHRLSTEPSAAQSPPLSEPGSSLPASSETAPALAQIDGPGAPPGDDQGPPDMGVPPIPGTSPEPPAGKRKRGSREHLRVVNGNTLRKATAEDSDDDLPPKLSDSHLAQVWIDEHGDDWRYVADWSSSDKPCWMQWDGAGWRRDKVDAYWPLVERLCIRAANWPEGRALSENDRRKLTGAAKYGSIVRCISKANVIASTSEEWDTDIWALGIPGGWVDLRTGAIQEQNKSRHISMRTSVVPEEGLHPLFDRVIERPAHSEPEMLAYLWNLCGYMLTGDVSQERFFYLLGPQNSGKSTLARVLSDILGDYAAALPSEALVESLHPRHSQEWARLQNKRLVVSSELKGTSRWSEDLVKRITSGEKITARYMRQNDLEWYPHFKLLVDGGQEIPSLSNPGGMERRLDLIEYPPLDCAMDTTLKARLVAEYPAILHSLIVACLQYQEHGLPRPRQVQDDSADYISTQDNLGGWIADRIITQDGARLKTAEARTDFEAWIERQDGRKPQYPVSPKLFALRMKGRGFAVAKSGVKYFLNVQLRDEADMFPQD